MYRNSVSGISGMPNYSNAHAKVSTQIFEVQFPGNWFEFCIIGIDALQSELFRFKFQILSSKILEIPEFSLVFFGSFSVLLLITCLFFEMPNFPIFRIRQEKSHEKIIFHMLFGAFHDTSRTSSCLSHVTRSLSKSFSIKSNKYSVTRT